MTKEEKYGDNSVHEPWADNNIFLKLDELLVDPLYNIGLTPNMVTILSTLFTLASVYFLSKNEVEYAIAVYLFGYLLDSVDGKMARRYNMGSKFGMALDTVSDFITNNILFFYLLYKYGDNISIQVYIIFFIVTYCLLLSHSINEGIKSHKEKGSDNFYKMKFDMVNEERKGLEKIIYDIYLLVGYIEYVAYKFHFPVYNEERLYRKLKVIKEFGPGNYTLFICLLVIYLNY